MTGRAHAAQPQNDIAPRPLRGFGPWFLNRGPFGVPWGWWRPGAGAVRLVDITSTERLDFARRWNVVAGL